MRSIKSGLIVLILVAISGCASLGFGHKERQRNDLLNRANHFYEYLELKDTGKMYGYMYPSKQRYFSKADYVKSKNEFLDFENKTYYYGNSKIVVMEGKVAITETTIVVSSGDFDNLDCQRMLWLRYYDVWFNKGYPEPCTFTLSKKQMKLMAKQIPNR